MRASIMRWVGPPRSNHDVHAPTSRSDGPLRFGPADVPRLLTIALAAIATLLAVTLEWESPLRVLLTLGFLVFGPGLALAELLEISDAVQRIAVATGASLALETLVAVSLLYAGLFSTEAAVAIVVGLTCIALLAAVLRRGWHVPPPGPNVEPPTATT